MGAGSQKGNRGNLCTVPWTGPWLQNGRDCNQGRKPRPNQRNQPGTPKSRPISITNPRPQTNQPSRTVDKCNKSIPSYTKSVHYSACWVRQDVAWWGGVGQRAAGQDRAGQGAAERSRVAAGVRRARLGGPLQNTPRSARSRYLERTLERNRSAPSRASPCSVRGGRNPSVENWPASQARCNLTSPEHTLLCS